MFSCLLPAVFWPGSTSYEAIKLTLFGVTAALLVAYAAWRWRHNTILVLPLGWFLFSGGAILLAGLIALLWALNRSLALQGMLLLVAWFCLAFAYSSAITERRHLVSFLRATLAGSIFAAVYGQLQISGVLAGAPPETGALPGISSLGNQNYLAGLLGVAFFPSLILWRGGGRIATTVAVAMSCIILVTVFRCGAMGPLLSLLAAGFPLALALLLTVRNRSAWVPRALAVSLVLGAAILIAGWNLAQRAPSEGPDGKRPAPNPVRRLYNRNAGDMRLTDWTVGFQMLQDKPLTGVGLNNYQVTWPEYRARLVRTPDGPDWATHAPRATKAHNEYIQVAAETGEFGVIILLAIGITSFFHYRRRFLNLQFREQLRQEKHQRDPRRQDRLRPGLHQTPETQIDFLLVLAGIGVAAAHAVVSFPFHLPATTALLALLFGALESPYFGTGPRHQIRLRWYPLNSWLLIAVAALGAAGSLREFSADLIQRRGIEALKIGRYDRARSLLEQAVTQRLWPGQGLFYLAISQAATTDSDECLETLRISLRTEPTFEAYLILAEELRDRRRFDEAQACLKIVDGCEPTERFRQESQYVRATVALRQEDHSRARSLLDDLLAAAPLFHRGWIAYGYLEALAGNNIGAAEHYQRALAAIDTKMEELVDLTPSETANLRTRLQKHRATALRAIESLGL